MPATYSIPTPGQDATSYANINDILSLLPDNTSQLIAPKDIRDAVFSNWENSVIRYAAVSGTDYIGISRDDVKNTKIFLGKKQLSGSNIMSSTLLSSNTDIFFYNTKSDTGTQNFKMQLLAGTNSSLYQYAPYIEVQGVASPSSLNLNIGHGQALGGDFNFVAGLNGYVTLNKLKFPTQNEFTGFVGTPTFSTTSDFYLTVDNSGVVFVKKFSGFLPDGSELNPSLSFLSDTNTGIFRVSSDTLGFTTGGVQRATLSDAGLVLTKATASQTTNISQGVTLNSGSGLITTMTASAAAGLTNEFVFSNSFITSNSIVFVKLVNYSGSQGNPIVEVFSSATGSADIVVTNLDNTDPLNGSLRIGFVVF
jgi:hypothetical protein